LRRVFVEERNFRIHVVAGVFALGLAGWLRLPVGQLALLVFTVIAVLLLEILNTVVERVVDALAPRLSYLVRDVKDMMAGAVLLGAVAAVRSCISKALPSPVYTVVWML
jgi:diacylglycerol kinase (ATP)